MIDAPLLLILNLVILTSIAFYNFFGLSVTQYATAVHRTLIDACRTIFVWGFSSGLYYYYKFIDPNFAIGEEVGEELKLVPSLIQAGGFVLLVMGTLLYNEVVKPPCFNYDKPEEEEPLLE